MYSKFSDTKTKLKKIVFILISSFIMIMILSAAVMTASAKVDYEDNWAKETISIFLERGIISPVDLDGNLKPQIPITRAEVAAAINKTYGYTQTVPINYKDADPSAWYYKDLQIAKAEGYMIGDGTYVHPNNPISREELSTVIGRILKLPKGNEFARSFTDVKSIADWSIDYVGALAKEKVLLGYPDGKFQPKNNITRAEAFTVLLRSEKLLRAIKNDVKNLQSVTVTSNLGDGKTIQNYMDVTITNKGIVLDGAVVNGDLIIEKEVADGSITLKNVTVRGGTYIYGGGSVTVTDSALSYVVLNSAHNTRLLFNGTGINSAGRIIALSGGTIEILNYVNPDISVAAGTPTTAALTVKGTANKIDVKSGSSLIMQGKINTLNVMTASGANAKITVDTGGTVSTANFSVPASVTGNGTINTANLNSGGVVLSANVNSVVKKPEVEGTPIIDALFESLTVTNTASGTNNYIQLTAVFDKGINEGLTASDFNVRNATLMSVTGSGKTYVLNISNVTAKTGESVYVTVQKTGYNIKTATRSVNLSGAAIEFKNLTANGSSTAQTTTLTITFDKAVPGLTAGDFTVTGATRGTLSGTGPVYYLTLTNITVDDRKEVNVKVSKTNYLFTPDNKNVVVYNPSPSLINLTHNGSETASTTQFTITFNREIPGLSSSDFTISAANGSTSGITRGTLTQDTNNKSVYYLTASFGSSISDNSRIYVKVAKNGYTFSPNEKDVIIRRLPDISFSLNHNGTSSVSTTQLTLSFGSDIDLNTDNITLVDNWATKGTLSKLSNGVYTLTISNIIVSDNAQVKVRVSRYGYNFSPNEREFTVRRHNEIPVTVTFTQNGSSSITSTEIYVDFSNAVTGLNANDAIVSLSGTGIVFTGQRTVSSGNQRIIIPIDMTSATSNTVYLTISISPKSGYSFTPTSGNVTVYKAANIQFSYTANGSSTEATTAISITFSGTMPIPNISESNITLNVNGIALTKGSVTTDGSRTYYLSVGVGTTATVGTGTATLSISGINGYIFTSTTSGVTVYGMPSYTLSYNATGGSPVPPPQVVTITLPTTIATISSTIPVREGFTFIGWSDGANTYLPGNNITMNDNITLFAVWEANNTEPPD